MRHTIHKILQLEDLPSQIKPVLEQFISDFNSHNSDAWNEHVKGKSENYLKEIILENGSVWFDFLARKDKLTPSELISIYNYTFFPITFYVNYKIFSELYNKGFHNRIITNLNPIFIDYGCGSFASSCAFSITKKENQFKNDLFDYKKGNDDSHIQFSEEYSIENRSLYLGIDKSKSLIKFIKKYNHDDFRENNLINNSTFNMWSIHADCCIYTDTFIFNDTTYYSNSNDSSIADTINSYINKNTKLLGEIRDLWSNDDQSWALEYLFDNGIKYSNCFDYSIIVSLSFSLSSISITKQSWDFFNSDTGVSSKKYENFSDFENLITLLNEISIKFGQYNIVVIISDFISEETEDKIRIIDEKTSYKKIINGNIDISDLIKNNIAYTIFYKSKYDNLNVSQLTWGNNSKPQNIQKLDLEFSKVVNILSSDNIIKLDNNVSGYYLDFHTVKSTLNIDGSFDTERTYLGELLYQLKYCFDKSKIEPISELVSKMIINTFAGINIIIPIPPSNLDRPFQPVSELAQRISEFSGIPTNLQYLKKKATPALKSIDDLQVRKEILANAFSVIDKRFKGKTVLLFDDLYRSGETLNAAVKVLREQGEVDKIYVFTITKTRTKR
jgi:competence protein ComFC